MNERCLRKVDLNILMSRHTLWDIINPPSSVPHSGLWSSPTYPFHAHSDYLDPNLGSANLLAM